VTDGHIDMNDLKIQNKCCDCSLRNTKFFCDFSYATTQLFQAIKITKGYAKGFRLFTEGQQAAGIFILCRGRVKLTTHSRAGKALILRIAEAGEVLGLYASVSGSFHEATAEMIEDCQVNFVELSEFRRFLEQNPEAAMNALRDLSRQYKKAYLQVRSLGLSTCVADKLATILLEWSKDVQSVNGSIHLKNPFSHEAIAEMIGTSRETVTRLLKELREKDLITVSGTDLFIRDRIQLEATIGR
jgi:CRP/FNR family cyclic AMP-dependent transcriptional regulator